jgi:acyl-CoA dehydrogenase
MNAGPTKERLGLDSRLALRPPNEDCSRQASADDCQRKQHFQLTVAHLFSLIVYGLLSLEQAALTAGLDRDVVDQIFDFQKRDFSTYAVALHDKPSSTRAQQHWAVGAIRKPVPDAERFGRVWERVKAYSGPMRCGP